MPGIGIGLNRRNRSSATSPILTGLITVSNGSNLRSVTIKKTDTKGKAPSVGWHIITVGGGTGTISGVTSSGSNYVITYTGGNAFSGGGNTAWSIYRG